MRIEIRHELRFSLPEGTNHSVQHVLMKPRETKAQSVLDWSISMPGIDGAARFIDAFGNIAHLVSQTRASDELTIVASGIIETLDSSGVTGKLPDDPNVALFRRVTTQTKPNGNLVNRLRAQLKAGMSRVELMHWLMNRLHEARDGTEHEADEAVEIVAEDHAHVFIAALRGIDVPARFVTGYVLDAESGPARLHAWAEGWDDGLGWIGFDPSADICPTQSYVRLAAGLDAETAAPIRLVPDLLRASDDTIKIAQVSMNQQQ